MSRYSFAEESRQGRSRRQELHWFWFGLFVVALSFLGGSSWPDPMHHALLRPIAALLMIPALNRLSRDDVRRGQFGLLLLGAVLVWMILQLVPLPRFFWQALPDRHLVLELDELTGLKDSWRPISLTPFRGINAVFGMVVPLAALVVALATRLPARSLLSGIFGMGLFNAALVLLQVIGGSESPFYLFPKPSPGAAEGMFANENHSAVFSAIVMLVIARLALSSKAARDATLLRLAYVPAFILVLLAILVSGSRAGLAASLIALVASAGMIWLSIQRQGSDSVDAPVTPSQRSAGVVALSGCAAAAVTLITIFLWLQRTPAFEDIISTRSFDDLRWSLWPVLLEMVATHWVLGTGFGSFEAVYRTSEPTALLLPFYVNHAHNDFAQLVIEGGLPAIVLLAVCIWWFARAVIGLRDGPRRASHYAIFWTACILIIAAASIVDYPLRTPAFQAVAIWLMVCLSTDRAKVAAA